MNNSPPSRYVKEPATPESQLAKLQERGCIVADKAFAKAVLEKINYYRLANYFSVFQEFQNGQKRFVSGTSFEKILRLYDFDRRLRGQLLIFLEEIEVQMRAVISNHHALKYGALGYLNESTFARHHNHHRFITTIEGRLAKNTDLGFVSHHNEKYSGAFPLWVIMELFSFGMLSRFFKDLHKSDKKAIADKLGGGARITAGHSESWLDSLTALRNLSAHYCRLYGNTIEPAPKPLAVETATVPFEMDGSLFSFIYVISLLDKPFGGDKLTPLLGALLEEYEDVVDLGVLGFRGDWRGVLSKTY